MNRRSFITRLASGVVGLSLVDTEWIPRPVYSHLSSTAPLTDIEAITSEFLKRLVHCLPDLRSTFVPADYVRGMSGSSQLRIDMMLSPLEMERGINADAYLEPAAYHMAHAINDKRLRTFGALVVDIPGVDAAVATDETTGATVRGIRAYNLDRRAGELRFDVLGKAA